MITALALALLAPVPGPIMPRADDPPPVQVWLNSDHPYMSGERAKVYVRARDDGYLVVLRVNGDGRVRVLFPLDPGDDNFVRGDHKFEVRGRGDRDAFVVDELRGTGFVLAAWSPSQLGFDSFVRGDHWDYRTLGDLGEGDDRETALLDIVQRMAGEGHFEYDIANYSVATVTADDYHSGPYFAPGFVGFWGGPQPGISLTVGFGVGWGPYCGSYWGWGPWGCGIAGWPYYPFYPYRPYVYRPWGFYPYRPYAYGFSRPFGYAPYARPYTFGGGFYSPYRPAFANAPPRLRIPDGSLASRTTVAAQSWSARGLRSVDGPGGGRIVAAPTRSSHASGSSTAAPRRSSGGVVGRSFGGGGSGWSRSGSRGGGGRAWGGGGGGGGGRRGGGGGGGGGGARRR